jgi:hypothetical protein
MPDLLVGEVMNRTPVLSSNLVWVGFDEVSQTLEVAFQNGGVYRYHGVPASVYQALMAAASHGSYFSAFIRNRYPASRIA